MFVLPINKVNSYSNQKQKPNFNGLAEAELFKRTVEDIPYLKHGLAESIKENGGYSLYSVFNGAYNHLQQIFRADGKNFKVSTVPRGFSGFSFIDSKGRKVRISLQSANPGIFYYESKNGLSGRVKDSIDISYLLESNKIKKVEIDIRDRGCLRANPQRFESFLYPDGDKFTSTSQCHKDPGRVSGSSC